MFALDTQRDFSIKSVGKDKRQFQGFITFNGGSQNIVGNGNGPISSFIDAINSMISFGPLEVLSYHEHSVSEGTSSKAVTYIEMTAVDPRDKSNAIKQWGIGIHEDLAQASIEAILSVLNSIARDY